MGELVTIPASNPHLSSRQALSFWSDPPTEQHKRTEQQNNKHPNPIAAPPPKRQQSRHATTHRIAKPQHATGIAKWLICKSLGRPAGDRLTAAPVGPPTIRMGRFWQARQADSDGRAARISPQRQATRYGTSHVLANTCALIGQRGQTRTVWVPGTGPCQLLCGACLGAGRARCGCVSGSVSESDGAPGWLAGQGDRAERSGIARPLG